MRFSSLAAQLSLLAYVSQVYAADSDVISLTTTTFKEVVDPESLILVEFFAPWCGHCKALAPAYEEAATALKEKGIKLAKVDCVEEADFCQANGVQGYPTLKVYKNGSGTEYAGPRQADGIISYMTKQSLPAVSGVTAANHDEFQNADKIVIIAYLESSTQEPAPEFSAAAEKHRDDYLFGLTTDQDVTAAAGVTPPAVVVYRSFDEPRIEFPLPASSLTVKELEDWVQELAIPLVDQVSGDNYATYVNSGKPLAYLFLDPTTEDREAHIDTIKTVAKKYKSKINFVWIDAIKFGDHARALNLQQANWPSFVIQDLQHQLKFPLNENQDVTTDAVTEWVESYLAGTLEPSLKSAPIPESQDESVFDLVGKQFEEVVFDDSKDVFVEFYATWCGHCKRLKPIWDSVGDHFASVKDRVTIAKMEATENDLPPSVPFRISGFPTLKFKAAGTREFIDYEGDRSLESLIAFVQEHAKNSLEAPAVPVQEDAAQTPLAAQPTQHAEAHHDEEHDEL